MFIVILNYFHHGRGELNSSVIGTYGTLTTRKIDEDVKKYINNNLDDYLEDYEIDLIGHYLPIKKIVDVEQTTYLSLPKLNDDDSDDDDD